jgi:hypothetical protein
MGTDLISDKERKRLAWIRSQLASGENPYDGVKAEGEVGLKHRVTHVLPLAVRLKRWRDKADPTPVSGKVTRKFKAPTVSQPLKDIELRCVVCGAATNYIIGVRGTILKGWSPLLTANGKMRPLMGKVWTCGSSECIAMLQKDGKPQVDHPYSGG